MQTKMKGQIMSLATGALALVLAIIIIAVAALIVGQMQNVTDNTSQAYSVLTQGLTAISQFSLWFVIIALVVAAVVVIRLLVTGFGAGFGGGGRRGGA